MAHIESDVITAQWVKVSFYLGKLWVNRTKDKRQRITMIQACHDEPLVDGKRQVHRRNNITEHLFLSRIL